MYFEQYRQAMLQLHLSDQQFIYFHSRKCIWKCRQEIGGSFCLGLNVFSSSLYIFWSVHIFKSHTQKHDSYLNSKCFALHDDMNMDLMQWKWKLVYRCTRNACNGSLLHVLYPRYSMISVTMSELSKYIRRVELIDTDYFQRYLRWQRE